jgi:UvrA DNA-binding domain
MGRESRRVVRQPRSDGVIKKWSNEKITTPTLQDSSTPTVEWEELRHSTDYGNAETGMRIGELTPRHFSFNSHLGACPACHGLGTQLVCDPDLIISDPSKTLAEGAITPWQRGTKRMHAYYQHLQEALVKHFNVDEDMRTAGTNSSKRFTSARMERRSKWISATTVAQPREKLQNHSRDWCRRCSGYTSRLKANSLVHDLRTVQSMQWSKAQTRNPRSPIIHKRKKLLTRTPPTIFLDLFSHCSRG